MIRHLRAGLLLVLALASSGCAQSVFLTIEDFTEEQLGEVTFPAPNTDLVVMRSAYIAGAIGLYAAHAVESYSANSATGDAERMVNRLDFIVEQLNAQRQQLNQSARVLHFDRLAYVYDAFGLIEAASEPTRRYYRERAVGLIASRDPVAIARTAFQALRALTRVTAFRDALLVDGREHVIEIVARDSGGPVTAGEASALIARLPKNCGAGFEFATAPTRLTGAAASDPVPLGDAAWWHFLPLLTREKLCGEASAVSNREWAMALDAMRISRLLDQRARKPDNNDWARAGHHLASACERLHQLSRRAPEKKPSWCGDASKVFAASAPAPARPEPVRRAPRPRPAQR